MHTYVCVNFNIYKCVCLHARARIHVLIYISSCERDTPNTYTHTFPPSLWHTLSLFLSNKPSNLFSLPLSVSHTHTNTHKHTRMHTRTHTHIHAHTLACECVRSLSYTLSLPPSLSLTQMAHTHRPPSRSTQRGYCHVCRCRYGR